MASKSVEWALQTATIGLWGMLVLAQPVLAHNGGESSSPVTAGGDPQSGADDGGMETAWQAILQLPALHQGEVSYKDIDEGLIHRFGCAEDPSQHVAEAAKGKGDGQSVYTRLRCSNGIRITYAGERQIRAGRAFSYDLNFYWEPASACIRAGRALDALNGTGWMSVPHYAPTYPDPPSLDEGLANYQSFTSTATDGLTLTVLWAPFRRERLLTEYPAAKSCVRAAILALRVPP
jgi:hypothetical protein